MTPSCWVGIGVLAGTLIGFVCAKRKDVRAGVSVGIGFATAAIALLSRLL